MITQESKAIAISLFVVAVAAAVVVACGGGGGGPSAGGGGAVPAYTVSGTLSGLPLGNTVVLRDNGADDLTLASNGAFTFATPVDANALYSVTVATQPATALCSVANGSGNVGNSPVGNVVVTCSPVTTYTLGGRLMGLAPADAVDLQYNGANDLALSVNGPFTFVTPLVANTSYTVTVLTPPAVGVCAVTNGTGTIAASSVSNVIVSCDTVSTLAGSGTAGATEGTGTSAAFSGPMGGAVDGAGNVFVADTGNNKIRLVTAAGVTSTVAGSGSAGATEGTGTAASFNAPGAVAQDANGNLYVADTNNNKIRLIAASGVSYVVSTLAGSGSAGSTDGTGAAASFNRPTGVAVDASGNVYVADTGNHKIRKIAAGGVVTTLAGSGTAGSADGTGTSAGFSSPAGVAVNSVGNVFVADTGNNKIRMVTAAGAVTTFAGSGAAGATDATGTAASFSGPVGITVDTAGNVYVADANNHKIRQISATGVVTTWAGTGTAGATDATGSAATFNVPKGVMIDSADTLYIGDTSNNKIRKIVP